MKEQERTAVLREVRRILEEAAFEALRLTVGQDRSVHVVLDRADRRVSVEDTTRMNLRIRRELEAKGFDVDSYSVEVESPGAFRPLNDPKHFIRFRGERIRVVRRDPAATQRVVVGVLEAADERTFRIAVEGGKPLELPYTDVADARLEPRLPF